MCAEQAHIDVATGACKVLVRGGPIDEGWIECFISSQRFLYRMRAITKIRENPKLGISSLSNEIIFHDSVK